MQCVVWVAEPTAERIRSSVRLHLSLSIMAEWGWIKPRHRERTESKGEKGR